MTIYLILVLFVVAAACAPMIGAWLAKRTLESSIVPPRSTPTARGPQAWRGDHLRERTRRRNQMISGSLKEENGLFHREPTP